MQNTEMVHICAHIQTDALKRIYGHTGGGENAYRMCWLIGVNMIGYSLAGKVLDKKMCQTLIQNVEIAANRVKQQVQEIFDGKFIKG